MTLLEQLAELTGDKEIAQKVLESGLMIPQDKFNEKINEIKGLKEKIGTVEESYKSQLQQKSDELYEYKTSQMTEEQKSAAEIERLTNLYNDSLLKQNKATQIARLTQAGFDNEEEISKLVDTLVTTNTEQSNESIGLIINTRKNIIANAQKEVETNILNGQQDYEGGDLTPPENKELEDLAFEEGFEDGLRNL